MTTQKIPDWYCECVVDESPDKSVGPTGPTGPDSSHASRAAGKAVRRALSGLAQALAREMSSPVCGDSWLGRLEPRAKVAGIIIMVFGATLPRTLEVLSGLLVVALGLAVSVRLPVRRLARVWLGVPLFGFAIILPATLNLVTPGDTVVTLWKIGHVTKLGPWVIPEVITVTHSGLTVAGRFLLRSLDCVTLTYLLVASTDAAVLMDALRRLGMPRVFGMVISMAQRYVAVLLRVAEEIHLAKLSRTISPGSLRGEQRWAAAGMGMLFHKTHRLAQEVESAMAARGYDGDLQIRFRPPLRLSDHLWMVAAIVVTGSLIAVDMILAGRL